MKKILMFFTCVLFTASVYGQEDKAITQRLEEKYGFVCYHDTEGGWYSIKKGDYHSTGNEGACDLRGREVIPPIWDDVNYGGTYYKVKKNGKLGIRGLKNEEILPIGKYDDIMYHQMAEHDYCEVKIGLKIGVIDKQGNEVIPCEYDDISIHQIKQYGFAEVKKGGKKGVYDIRLKSILIPCMYDDIRSTSLKEQSFCNVAIGNLQGVYDTKTKREIIPCKFDDIRSFELKDMNFCRVEKDGLCGLVTKEGNMMVPCQYEEIEEGALISSDFCKIVYKDKYGVLNKNGEEVVPCKYGYITFDYSIKNNYAFVQPDAVVKQSYWDENDNYKFHSDTYIKKGKVGVVNLLTRKEIIPCEYVDIQMADDNLFTFNLGGELPTSIQDEYYNYNKTTGGKWGCIDETNKVLIPAEYDNPITFKDGVAQVSKDGVTGLLPHPQKGTSLTLANSAISNDVDNNIPISDKHNNDTFVFVIANENYTHLKGADYAINDGKVFADYCKKTLGVPDNNVRYFEDASYGNLLSAIKKIEDIAGVYEGDATIIFYYSGLGTVDEHSKERYILPVDADIATVSKTGYNVQQLLEKLNALETKGTLALIDAPFSGTDRLGKPLTANRGVRISPKKLIPQDNILICFGDNGNECCYASSKYGHGLFTYGLLKKLKESKGNIIWKEWINGASALVKKSSTLEFGRTQNPAIIVSDTNPNLSKISF